MEIMNNKTFQCEQCMENNSEARRVSFGCKKIKDNPMPIKHYNISIEFYKCPGNFYKPAVRDLLLMEQKFEQGVMPFEGALMDQPAKVIEAMELVSITRDRILKEKK